MAASFRSWTPVLLIVACLVSAGNAGLYMLLSKRFATVESAVASLASNDATGARQDQRLLSARPESVGSLAYGASGSTGGSGTLARQIKQQKAEFNPSGIAASMDRLMTQEPSLPAIEQAQVNLLQQAIQTMPANAPRPTGLQTTCKGRRCLISAGFMDDTQAGEWADRLLLAGGKNLPKAARIVPVPLEGGNGAVSLQLYLY